MSDQINASDCQKAHDVICNQYAQTVRIVFLGLQFVQFFVLLPLAFEYKRKRVVLHGNLKFLYVNLVIVYQLSPFGYSLAEFRHLYLAFFSCTSPCSMLVPLWYVFLSRCTISMYNYSIPILHFVIMVERLRATMLVKHYEFEGIKFGIWLILGVYAIVLLVTGVVAFQVLSDYNFNFFQLLAVNSLTTKSSNLPVLYFTYFLIFVVMMTALGDYLIYKKNKELKKKVKPAMGSSTSSMVVSYNLSEKYQLQENEKAMQLILPLDIAYMVAYVLYSILVIVLRSYQPFIPFTIYLAHYNVIAYILTLYTIASMSFYRRFLLTTIPGKRTNGKNITQVMPMDRIGHVYFEQLRAQWN